ncbi:hypothetical protein AB0H83_45515 [Dactylosporangium sp. NPDC050688]|uniref:hypothetical protein n=1 Tax=Dactylosporangium sp. NPDC050688 TaxID=3157217 RepID=UPI0033DCF522
MTATIPSRAADSAPELVDQQRLTGRRVVDPAVRRRFHASMRNDFLTPRGTPYKWHDMTATLHRTVLGGGVPTLVPVRYEWERVDVRTGTPTTATDPREWTFARRQGFSSVLLHAEAGAEHTVTMQDAGAPVVLDVSYPGLPRSPAVDLLLMLSWDVVTFEMMCTHLLTTPGLREPGDRAELERISGSWAELQFSDPGSVAVFRNANIVAELLGHGRFAGRPSAVYTTRCLDCVLDVRSGPVRQRGRSSYWATLQVDTGTGDLLCADMTEMIVATLTGADGRKVPVQKRRTVRMWADDGSGDPARGAALLPPRAGIQAPPPAGAATEPPAAAEPGQPAEAATDATTDAATEPPAAGLAGAVRLTEQVADYVRWQTWSLSYLPQGMADLAQMGYRSVVGTDLAGTGEQLDVLLSQLRAVDAGGPDAVAALRDALPEHRRHLEGLLAFSRIAVDGQSRLLVPDEASRIATRERLDGAGTDLTELLGLLEPLERPAAPAELPNSPTDRDCEGTP